MMRVTIITFALVLAGCRARTPVQQGQPDLGAPYLVTSGTWFGAGTPDAGIVLPDATLTTLSFCKPWDGGTAPPGTTWGEVQVTIDASSDARLLRLVASASPDAGTFGNFYLLLQVGILAGDAGVLELAALRQKLEALGAHPVGQNGYRRLIATPAHPECEVWVDRFDDPAVPSRCMCGSGCQVSPDGVVWSAANPEQVYGQGAAGTLRVRASGAGNCRNVPCGVKDGDQAMLDKVCM